MLVRTHLWAPSQLRAPAHQRQDVSGTRYPRREPNGMPGLAGRRTFVLSRFHRRDKAVETVIAIFASERTHVYQAQ